MTTGNQVSTPYRFLSYRSSCATPGHTVSVSHVERFFRTRVPLSESCPRCLSPKGLYLPDREDLSPLDCALRQVPRHPAPTCIREGGGSGIPVLLGHRPKRGCLYTKSGPECPFVSSSGRVGC